MYRRSNRPRLAVGAACLLLGLGTTFAEPAVIDRGALEEDLAVAPPLARVQAAAVGRVLVRRTLAVLPRLGAPGDSAGARWAAERGEDRSRL